MPLPRTTETAEQAATRRTATEAIEARPDFLPRHRWNESADAHGNYQMVRLYWDRKQGAYCTEDNYTFAPWNGDMQGMRFVTIG